MRQTVANYAEPATDVSLMSLKQNLEDRNFEVVIADTGSEARDLVLARIPEGAEVHTAKSKTLEDIGLYQVLNESGKYDFLRHKLYKLDRRTQAREMRKLVSAPDWELGSVQAVTEAGQLVVASATGSQMGPYSAGSGHLILVVGSQKVVPNLDAALARITDYVQPWEDSRLLEQYNMHTAVARVLILERDYTPGHTTVILVRE